MAMRGHGGVTFLDINDGSGKIQGLIKQDKLGEKGYQFFLDVFDIGDFVEVKGTLFITKRGEKTIEADDYKMLSKALIPLPEKWHGLQDVEEKLRKRYLDIIFSPEVKDMIEKRAKFWNSTREFLVERGFLEVETPVLETTAGGADAKPFMTHHNALNLDVYLRISTGELWQKKLMVAGFEKTFEIGRQFRNEGMDAEHLQDYTQMEFYWAYSDYEQGMKLVEEMYKYIAKKTFGTLKFKIKDFDVDLGGKWEKYDYVSIISKYTKVNVLEASLQEMEKALQDLKIDYDKNGFNRTRAMDNLWKFCRKKIGGPGFLINTPIEVSPLAKRNEKNKDTAMRFQVIIAGSENGNGYSELNNPIDQEERFAQQQKLREAGDLEAQMYDKDFVEALEQGMPPTCGFGFSERLFAFFIDKPLRDCQIFPLMKPKQ
jgi:lysyl-tRNA synthetase class 2